jgi:hypothetical protein
MNNYILIIGGIVSFVGMVGMIIFIRDCYFYEIGKIFSTIFITGILLTGLGVFKNIEEEKEKQSDEKVANISTKIIEMEKTNE